MSSELEHRLEGLFAEAPEPEAGAGEEALHRALHALHPAAPARRGIRTAVVAFATAAVLLAIAAGSLAAAGALHVSFGSKPKPKQRSTTSQLVLPQGASGVTAIVDGRLSVVTTGGFRLQGLPVTSAALSPHALFVAAGIGQSLVALKPSGRQAWSHPARGKVVAIAWAPFGNRIAYIIQIGHRLALHVIWGDGTHDTTIDRRVRAVRPSWRADSLAFAYVGAGGKAIVYDVGHRNRSILAVRAPVTGVAFAPAGRTLALSTPGSATVGGKTVATGEIEALGWQQDGRLEVALEMGVRPALVATFERNGRPLGGFRVPGRVVAITSGLVVTHTQNRIVAGWRRSTAATILRVSPAASVDGLEIG